MITGKERIDRIFNKKETDRPACLCPGGMMNMVTMELMDLAGVTWPKAHTDAGMMADLAEASFRTGCFDNVGVPFCMTIEAENLGAEVDLGSKGVEPHVCGYAAPSISEYVRPEGFDPSRGRAATVIEAIRLLKERKLDAPIVGNITGPISVASSVVDPISFYKGLRKRPEESHEFMAFVTKSIGEFLKAQVEAGADIITISDPSGTGEILGPKMFQEYAVRYINQMVVLAKSLGAKVIVHICGHMKSVYEQMNLIESDVLSFDSCVSMTSARSAFKDRVLMGNVSTYTLEFGLKDKVKELTRNCRRSGANIIAPACGLGTGSPLVNIRAIKEALEEDAADADYQN